MIEKELELDNEEVKKAIKHWVNEELDVKGKTNFEDISLKATRRNDGRRGLGSGMPIANGARVKIEVDYE